MSISAGRATLWSALDVASRQIVQFAIAIVLARILTPADFGAVAILIVFSGIATAVVQTGLTTPLIQRDSTHGQQSTIFWCALGLALLMAGGLVALGPLLAHFYGIPALRWLVFAVAAQIVLTALFVVQSALLARAMRFRAIAWSSMVATAVSGAVGIGMGFAGFGVWALVGHLVAYSAVGAALVWWVSGWRPGLRFRLAPITEMLRFGGWLSLSGLLDVLYLQGFALVLGKTYGLRDLGLYSRANNLQTIPGTTITAIIARVTLPFFSARGTDRDALVRAMLRTNRLTMLVNLPLVVGLGITADLVIRVLFGPQWVEAAPVLTVLAAAGILLPLQIVNQQLLLARGRAEVYFRVELAKKLIGIPILIAGSLYGLMGLAWAQLLAAAIGLAINVWPNGRDLGCGLGRQLANLASLIAASAAMAAIVLGLRQIISLPAALELLLLVAVGGIAFVAACWLLRVDALADAVQFTRGLWRTRRHPDAVAP